MIQLLFWLLDARTWWGMFVAIDVRVFTPIFAFIVLVAFGIDQNNRVDSWLNFFERRWLYYKQRKQDGGNDAEAGK